MQPLHRKPRILDIGCSTGNFLLHLKNVIPDVDLFGGDLMKPVVEECRANPDLAGIQFEVMDLFDLSGDFDIVVGNAITFNYANDDFDRAMKSIGRVGRTYVGYEYVFPGEREQTVEEKGYWNKSYTFHFRSETRMVSACKAGGFDEVEVLPFDIPVDLPKPEPSGTEAELATYTVRDEVSGRRLMFRGSLYQPWAHVVARKV